MDTPTPPVIESNYSGLDFKPKRTKNGDVFEVKFEVPVRKVDPIALSSLFYQASGKFKLEGNHATLGFSDGTREDGEIDGQIGLFERGKNAESKEETSAPAPLETATGPVAPIAYSIRLLEFTKNTYKIKKAENYLKKITGLKKIDEVRDNLASLPWTIVIKADFEETTSIRLKLQELDCVTDQVPWDGPDISFLQRASESTQQEEVWGRPVCLEEGCADPVTRRAGETDYCCEAHAPAGSLLLCNEIRFGYDDHGDARCLNIAGWKGDNGLGCDLHKKDGDEPLYGPVAEESGGSEEAAPEAVEVQLKTLEDGVKFEWDGKIFESRGPAGGAVVDLWKVKARGAARTSTLDGNVMVKPIKVDEVPAGLDEKCSSGGGTCQNAPRWIVRLSGKKVCDEHHIEGADDPIESLEFSDGPEPPSMTFGDDESSGESSEAAE